MTRVVRRADVTAANSFRTKPNRNRRVTRFLSVASSLRVDHDLAEHGIEEARISTGDASRFDVDITTNQRARTLDVQRRTKYRIVEARNITADVLSEPAGLIRRHQRPVVFRSGGGRLRGRRNRPLLSSVSTRPRAALCVVDEHRDAFQIHHSVAIAQSCNKSRAGNVLVLLK